MFTWACLKADKMLKLSQSKEFNLISGCDFFMYNLQGEPCGVGGKRDSSFCEIMWFLQPNPGDSCYYQTSDDDDTRYPSVTLSHNRVRWWWWEGEGGEGGEGVMNRVSLTAEESRPVFLAVMTGRRQSGKVEHSCSFLTRLV